MNENNDVMLQFQIDCAEEMIVLVDGEHRQLKKVLIDGTPKYFDPDSYEEVITNEPPF